MVTSSPYETEERSAGGVRFRRVAWLSGLLVIVIASPAAASVWRGWSTKAFLADCEAMHAIGVYVEKTPDSKATDTPPAFLSSLLSPELFQSVRRIDVTRSALPYGFSVSPDGNDPAANQTRDVLRFTANTPSVEALTLVTVPKRSDDLAPLRNAPYLKKLSLLHSGFHAADLQQLGRPRAIETASISIADLNDEALRSVATWDSLVDLSLGTVPADESAGDEPTTDETPNTDKQRTADESRTTNIERNVSPERCAITDAGVAALGRLTRLRRLVLAGGEVSGAGIDALRTCPQLAEIDLRGFQLDAGSAEALAKLPALEQLGLNGCSLNEFAVAALADVRRLKSVSFMYTNITDEQIAQLHTAAPQLEIRCIR